MERHSDDLYRKRVRQVGDYAIFMVDLGGCITSWNEGVEKVLGYREDEFMGRPAEIVFTPEDRAAGVPGQEMATARSKGRAFDDRWSQCKDGSRFWANGMMFALREDDGELLGYAKIMRDRTGARQNQEALQ